MAENQLIVPGMDEHAIGEVIQSVLSPVLETMAQLIAHNTEAMDRLAATQQVQTDRLEALERQVRLNTPVTPAQVRYFNDAIKKRAREALSKYDLDTDKKAVTKLAGAIRKATLTRVGAAALNEIPKHEYNVIIGQIQSWNDMLLIRDTIKEARERAEKERACGESTAGMDG